MSIPDKGDKKGVYKASSHLDISADNFKHLIGATSTCCTNIAFIGIQ